MRLGLAAFALATVIGAFAASAEGLQANQNGQMAEGVLSLGSFEDAMTVRRKPTSSPCRLRLA